MEDASPMLLTEKAIKNKFSYPATAPSSDFRLLFNVLPVISSLMSETMHLSELLNQCPNHTAIHCNQTDDVAIVWLPQESALCMPHERGLG